MAPLKPSGETNLRVCASMMVLVTIALLLRMLAKLGGKSGVYIEDWLIFVSTSLFYAYNGLVLEAVLGSDAGGTSNIADFSSSQLVHFLKYLYIEEIVFVLCITFTKLSILYFYMRIFSIQSFKRFVWVLVVLCVLWAVICLFVVIFQCSPIHAEWDFILVLLGKAKCVPITRLIFSFEIINVLLDVFILCLPIYMIKQLKLPTRRKIVVGSIFLLGGFVCVTCMVRMHFVFDPKTNVTRSSPGTVDWTTIELAAAIVCACLPTYGPLFKMAPTLSNRARSLYDLLLGSLSVSWSSKSRSYAKQGNSGNDVRTHDDAWGKDFTERKTTAEWPGKENHSMETMNAQRISEVV